MRPKKQDQAECAARELTLIDSLDRCVGWREFIVERIEKRIDEIAAAVWESDFETLKELRAQRAILIEIRDMPTKARSVNEKLLEDAK